MGPIKAMPYTRVFVSFVLITNRFTAPENSYLIEGFSLLTGVLLQSSAVEFDNPKKFSDRLNTHGV